MRNILDRVAVTSLFRSLFLALLCVPVAISALAQSGRAQDVRTAELMNMIQGVKTADSLESRREKATALVFFLKKTVASGHVSAVTDEVVQGLGELLEETDDRLDVALAISQIGPKAIVLAPKLEAVLEEERQAEEGSIVRQPVDAIDGICVALREMKATLPKICSERLGVSPAR
jgi:hypothetical protein